MPITRTVISAGASGLDAQQHRWYASVACHNVISPDGGVLRNRGGGDNSNTIKKPQQWGLNWRLVALLVVIIPSLFGVVTALKHRVAEHQHQLSVSQSGIQQLSALRTRQASIGPHLEDGGVQLNAAAAKVAEISRFKSRASSQGSVGELQPHIASERARAALLSQREQSLNAIDTQQANDTSSTQTQPSTTAAGNVSVLPSQTVGNTTALPSATATTTPVNVPTLLAGTSLTSPPSSPVSVSPVSTPTAAGAPAGPPPVLSGTTVLPVSSVPSPVVAVPVADASTGGPTILPLQTGGGGLPVLPVSQPTAVGQPSPTAPGSAAGATALPSTSVAPITSAVLLPSPTQVTQLAAVPAAITAPANVLQPPAAVLGVTPSGPAASPLLPPAPSTAAERLAQLSVPLTTTNAVPLSAAAPTGTPTAVPGPSASVPAGSETTVSEEEKAKPQTFTKRGTESAQQTIFSSEEGKLCANNCNCVIVAVAALLIFIICSIALLVDVILMGSLFSKGCLSKSFMRGGGWIILLAAALGLGSGLLVGGLISWCWTLALFGGGGFMDFAVSIVLVGTRGAWLGALGGAVSAATVAALINPTALPLSLGGVAGLLGGIVIGFVPILTGLEINVRYIRFRMRGNRGGAAARPRSSSRGSVLYGAAHQKQDSTIPRDSRRSTAASVEAMGGGLRSSVHPGVASPAESSDETTVTADGLASASRL